MSRYTKFARTLPPEHRNTPWVEFVPPVWSKRPERWVIVSWLCIGAAFVSVLALS